MTLELKHKKFLIIDDFLNFRKLLKRMLESLGAVHIDDAYNADTALRKMEIESYDIILCDYNLGHGKKDGQQVLEEAKHRGLVRYSSIFIMLTAENTMPMVMGAVEYKPDDYLIKPVSKEIVTRRIRKLTERKAALRDIDKAVRNKEYIHAIALCEEGVKTDPKHMMEYMRLKGDLCITIGRYDDAASVFGEALDMRDIPWAKMGLGKIHFLSGKFAEARDMFRSIIEENKTYMEAYDWLARALDKLGDVTEAQEALSSAIEISPKAILRHKELGKISYKIGDLDKAEEAYNSAIKIGIHSCFKSPGDYAGLAKILVKRDSPKKALSVLRSARQEFKESSADMLQTLVTEGMVFRELNREEDARQSISEAAELQESASGKVPVETTMELAKMCFEMGEKDQGIKFMQKIVKNNHDDDRVIRMVQGVFEDADLREEGDKIIKATRKEIVDLNNRGVELVREDRLENAIEFFEKAAGGLPDNKIINANAAQAFMMFMQKNGNSEEYLEKAAQYLDRVNDIDPTYGKYQKLLNMYEELIGHGSGTD